MTVEDLEQAAEAGPPQRRRDPVRLVARTLGELLITAGVLVLLFVVYQLVWTNVQADREAARETSALQEQWVEQPTSKEFARPLRQGKAFALMYIPRLGKKFEVPVVQGVSLDDLAKGVGHYPQSALPGRVGNFAVAGHRATNGEPFAYLDQLRAGDAVVVETSTKWYTYVVDDGYIVAPTQVEVVAPVPNDPQAVPTERLLTLT
ncbi:MAG: class E sortase, partial [Actinomycetota bacterium]|nr:class E sortase [Actinomycetota bacterium]